MIIRFVFIIFLTSCNVKGIGDDSVHKISYISSNPIQQNDTLTLMITEIPNFTRFSSLDEVSIKWDSKELPISAFWGYIVDKQNNQHQKKLGQLTNEYKNAKTDSLLRGCQLFQVIIPESLLGEEFIYVNLNGQKIKSHVQLEICE